MQQTKYTKANFYSVKDRVIIFISEKFLLSHTEM